MIVPADVEINVNLVAYDIRPATLIQPIDYNETSRDHSKTKSILLEIKRVFPDLIHSENYQGIIISKKSFEGEEIDAVDMGRVLGYPYYRNFGKPYTHTIEIVAVFIDGSSCIFYANVAWDWDMTIGSFQTLADNAKITLDRHQNGSYNGKAISQIVVEITKSVSIESIIEKLLLSESESELEVEDYNEINHILYNLGFNRFRIDRSSNSNKKQRGMIIALLLLHKRDPIEPFCPICQFPKQEKVYTTIQRQLEDAVTHDWTIVPEIDSINEGIRFFLKLFDENNAIVPFLQMKKTYQNTESDKRMQLWINDLVNVDN
jgi:hypothetical protein